MIKPYYETENGKLYHGDCLEILPQLTEKIDLVLTDPPYGVGQARGTIGVARAHKITYLTDCDTPDFVKNICIQVINKCLSFSKAIILTPGPKMFTFYPQPDSFGCFYQPASVGLQHWGRADSQPIFYYGRNPRVGKTITATSFVLTERASCDEHPCSKPLQAWVKLLLIGSLDNDLVLDPFLGSGTTAVACEKLGRRWIGIEISEEYCKIAVKRIERERSQMKLCL